MSDMQILLHTLVGSDMLNIYPIIRIQDVISLDETLNSINKSISNKSDKNHAHYSVEMHGTTDEGYVVDSEFSIGSKIDSFPAEIKYNSSEGDSSTISMGYGGIEVRTNKLLNITANEGITLNNILLNDNLTISKVINSTISNEIILDDSGLKLWKHNNDMVGGIGIGNTSIIGYSDYGDSYNGNNYPTCNDGNNPSSYPSIKGFYNIMGYNIEAQNISGDGSKLTGLKKSQIIDFPSSLPANGGTANVLSNNGFTSNQYGNFSHAGTYANDNWGIYNYGTTNYAFKVYYETGNAQFRGTVTAPSFSGNATSASKLQNSRTLTIGDSGKGFDGSSNITWSLNDIGAAPSLVHSSTDYDTMTTAGLYQMGSTCPNGPLVTGSDSKGNVSYAGLLTLKSDTDSDYFEQMAFKENTHDLFIRPGTSKWRKVDIQGINGYMGYSNIISASDSSDIDKWRSTTILPSDARLSFNGLLNTDSFQRILVLKGTYNINVSSATALTIKNKIVDFEPGVVINFTTTGNIGAVTLMDIQSSNINANNNYYFAPLKINVTDSYTQSVVLGIKANKSYINNVEFSGSFRGTFKSFYLNESELNRFSVTDTYSCYNYTGIKSEMKYSTIKDSRRTGTQEAINLIGDNNTITGCNGYNIYINSRTYNFICNNRASVIGSDSWGLIANNTTNFIDIQ